MEASAKLITAFAALLAAIAWPVAVIALGLIFRKQVRETFSRLPAFMDRLQKVKVPGLEAELKSIADASVDSTGKITVEQVEAAARISVEAYQYEPQITQELDKLCVEYDSIRRTMPSGVLRTRAMTRIVVKMRALAPAIASAISVYKSSGSPGSRLAAVAMMQMNSDVADIRWLTDRFSQDAPFIFYHAALAMQNLSNSLDTTQARDELLEAVKTSLARLTMFGPKADANTIYVLQHLLNDLAQDRITRSSDELSSYTGS